MRRVHSIVLHHTAGPQTATAADIRKKHILRKWRDIGYHFVVTKAGGVWHVENGRDLEKMGAHAGRGFPGNLGSIGIAVAGNYVTEAPPVEALRVLAVLLYNLQGKYGELMLWGHCDLNMTACPGQLLYNWIPELRLAFENATPATLTFDVAPAPRKLAEDRADARYFFKLRRPWVKGVGG